jgi:hypothetical protein
MTCQLAAVAEGEIIRLLALAEVVVDQESIEVEHHLLGLQVNCEPKSPLKISLS